MPVYKLRNGLSIDLTFETPQVLNPRPARLDFDPKSLYDSTLDAKPFPINPDGTPIAQTNVVKMRATGTLSGGSPDVFARCALRFIQLIRVRTFSVLYFGKRREEGSVTWSWSGQLLQRNIDCFVSEDGTQDSSPFQFPAAASTQFNAPNKLTGTLGDTPGATIPLAERNRESKRDNYLRLFNDRRNFESIITFVHPDGTREVLESWKWGFVRSVALKWVKLTPEIDGTNHIVFSRDPASTVVFGKDAEFADTLASGRIANRLTRDALHNIRTNPNVIYTATDDPNLFAPDGFWSP